MKNNIGTKQIEAEPMTVESAITESYKTGESTGEGYLVKYIDGYKSWSPKMAFEAAYQPTTAMGFSGALDALKRGFKVKKSGWSDDVYLTIQEPDENSKMTHPYIYVTSRFGKVPWVITQVEMLAEDWSILE